MADKRITEVDYIDSLGSNGSFFVNQNSSIKQINKSDVVFDISNGGTGATTATAALSNLGVTSGTWTPVLDGITEYVAQEGYWYRIGSLVTLLFNIRVSKSKSLAAGDTKIVISGFSDACGKISVPAGGSGLFNASGLGNNKFAGFFGDTIDTETLVAGDSFGPRMIESEGHALAYIPFYSEEIGEVLTMIVGSFTYKTFESLD